MIFFAGPGEVREFADRVAGDVPAEYVTARFGGVAGEGVEFGAVDIGRAVGVRADLRENSRIRIDLGGQP